MAKDFSQYDDSNPVMKTLRAAQEQEKQNSDANEILKSVQNQTSTVTAPVQNPPASVQNQTSTVTAPVQNPPASIETKTEPASEPVIEPKKILMNISIRETTKKDWKMFFLEHDLSMTQGIETAVEYLKSEVEKGNIRLSKGGITK